jgi:hypothetical protein
VPTKPTILLLFSLKKYASCRTWSYSHNSVGRKQPHKNPPFIAQVCTLCKVELSTSPWSLFLLHAGSFFMAHVTQALHCILCRRALTLGTPVLCGDRNGGSWQLRRHLVGLRYIDSILRAHASIDSRPTNQRGVVKQSRSADSKCPLLGLHSHCTLAKVTFIKHASIGFV